MRALSWFVLATTCALVRSEDIIINPWQLAPPNSPYPDFNATVGDTISFFWSESEEHTVFIYPSRTCDGTDGILIGDTSPVIYTFTEEDSAPGGNPILFADGLDQLCVWGMRFFVFVRDGPNEGTDAPTTGSSPDPTDPIATDPPETDPPETDAPTESATESATEATTEAPTTAPVAPTAAPVAPTAAPVAPTAAPVSPTAAPVAPTAAPVAPTAAPVTPEPTLAPVAPTPQPIEVVVTDEPTAIVDETMAPDAGETMEPTMALTESPVEDIKPTVRPTPEGGTSGTLTGLRMGLAGITSFPPDTEASWEQYTKLFSEAYAFSELNDRIENFVTTFEVTDVMLASSGQRSLMRGQGERDLQQDAVIIEYTQTMQYDTTDPSITADQLAQAPFESTDGKTSYVTLLRTSEDPVLEMVIGVSNVLVPAATPAPAPGGSSPGTQPPGGDEPVLSTAAIIGIACGGGAVLIMIVLYFLYCRSGGVQDAKGGDHEPPLHVSVREDEVSTLAGPTGPPTYGDQSVATVDYDYSKAYGGAGDTSVSSAGGTFGSNTHNQSALDPANAAATGAALGAMNNDHFDSALRDPNANVREEVIHIFAPPGKLGVVIDTPDDGAPVVHAVKDSSVIADKITVGDKLVAVDDEDVRSMTAIKVSKLISRKSANPSRKLTVIRTVLVE
mmetsp:Transcript_10518/g.18558  ORF Transcript_10518/g.18558 Transcript_10518/m.18558 type:complete len:673 (+) Transcript_10518:171-2189(+)